MSTQEHEAAAEKLLESDNFINDIIDQDRVFRAALVTLIATALADAVRVAREDCIKIVEASGTHMAYRIVADIRALAGDGDATVKLRERAEAEDRQDITVPGSVREGDATPGPEPDRCKDVHAETGQRCLEVSPHRMSGEYAMHRSASVSWLTLGESQPAAYPCADCGALRTEAQGGKTFTVCDACWDKHYSRATPPKKGTGR